MTLLVLPPFDSVETAAQHILAQLQKQLGFQLWMFTRIEGEHWIVLQAADRGYAIQPGHVFRWADSFCFRMVRGEGPRIAPRSRDIPAYVSAPIDQLVQIGAYIGVPLGREDGKLFGTLCAIDPEPQPDTIVEMLPIVELYAQLLSTILNTELRGQEAERKLEHALADAQIDELTKIYNRRGWEQLLATEEHRCRRYSSSATVLLIDLDEFKHVNDTQGHAAGDQLLITTARLLRQSVRREDIVARLGGDEFAILLVESSSDSATIVERKLRQLLSSSGIEASIGWATRDPGLTLTDAMATADARMYRDKRERKGLQQRERSVAR